MKTYSEWFDSLTYGQREALEALITLAVLAFLASLTAL